MQFGGDERTLRQPLPLVKSPQIRARDYFPEVAFAQSDLKIAIPLSLLVIGCGASPEVRANYAVEAARCITNERAIVDRASTAEEDARDLAIERARCDAALEAIGGAP